MRGQWHDIRWLEAMNTEAEEVPPHGLVRITDATLDKPGQLVLKVNRPTDENQYPLAINSHKPIPYGSKGLVTLDGPAFVKYDLTQGDPPAVGYEYGTHADSFEAYRNRVGLLYLGALDNARGLMLVEIARPSLFKPLIHFTLAENLTTAMETCTGTITTQFGHGYPSPYVGSGEILLINMPNSVTTWTFYGDSGHCGVAGHDYGNRYVILNLECP